MESEFTLICKKKVIELKIVDDDITLFDTANGNWYMIDDSDPNQYAWDPIVNRMVIKYSKGKQTI